LQRYCHYSITFIDVELHIWYLYRMWICYVRLYTCVWGCMNKILSCLVLSNKEQTIIVKTTISSKFYMTIHKLSWKFQFCWIFRVIYRNELFPNAFNFLFFTVEQIMEFISNSASTEITNLVIVMLPTINKNIDINFSAHVMRFRNNFHQVRSKSKIINILSKIKVQSLLIRSRLIKIKL
jgi:hypothetical protein